jgi:hypothetical protein
MLFLAGSNFQQNMYFSHEKQGKSNFRIFSDNLWPGDSGEEYYKIGSCTLAEPLLLGPSNLFYLIFPKAHHHDFHFQLKKVGGSQRRGCQVMIARR